MIYAGQNNGYPEGPVGENAAVEGDNFTSGQQVRLVLVKGDSNTNAALCQNPAATVGTATADGTGKFYQNFSWPVAAGQVNQEYSICADAASTGNVVSSQDDGPFTLLSASPPAINVSTSSVAAGNTVTITGQNWVPPQQVNINIAGCADCEPGNTEVTSSNATSSGLNTGTFSVTVTIPASTKPGNYVIDALTQSGMDANYTTGVKHLTITSLIPTPTPTSAVTPTPTVTTTPTPATTATSVSTVTPTTVTTTTANTTSSSNGGDSGGSFLTIALFVAIAVVVLAIISIFAFMFMQRSKRRNSPGVGTPPGSNRPPVQPMPPLQPNNYGPLMQQGSSPGNFQQRSSPNNYQQSFQQNGSPNMYGQQAQQSMPPVSPTFSSAPTIATNVNPAAYVSQCRNCGRPLTSNDLRCGGCGMPIGIPR